MLNQEARNPIGRGVYARQRDAVDQALPNLEAPGTWRESWNDRGTPCSFGPIPGSWQPRLAWAGTYDQQWVDERIPLWPDDTDPRFFCAAAPGLSSDRPLRGGEVVLIEGMAPRGDFAFHLPDHRIIAKSIYSDRTVRGAMRLEAVLLEPDEGTVTLFWRRLVPLGHGPRMHLRSIVRLLENWEDRPGMMCAAISGMGVCTPLGLTASSTEAAFRAGLMPACETTMKSRGGEPIRALYLDLLPDGYGREERMAALAGHALDDLAKSAPVETGGPVSAFVGLPELDGELFAATTRAIASLVSARATVVGPPMFFCQGRSALFFALDAALAALAAGACNRALVGAVESLCSPEMLKKLDADRRLLGLAAEGIIPAEGAAFLLLERSPAASGAGTVVAAATGRESRHFGQSRPSSAQALSGVLRALRGQPVARGRRAGLMYTCETGRTFLVAGIRAGVLAEHRDHARAVFQDHRGGIVGDLGAAAGGVMLVMGVHALARLASRRQSERLFLLCGCSDDGHVGACLIEGPAEIPVGV